MRFDWLSQSGSVISLQGGNKNIRLIGPIAVQATGPKTFRIVDIQEREEHSPASERTVGKFVELRPEPASKRPSLQFLPAQNTLPQHPNRKRESLAPHTTAGPRGSIRKAFILFWVFR